MAKEPKKPTKRPPLGPPLESADGPIPWDNWDDDQRCRDDSKVDTSPGSVYDHLTQRDKLKIKPSGK